VYCCWFDATFVATIISKYTVLNASYVSKDSIEKGLSIIIKLSIKLIKHDIRVKNQVDEKCKE